MRRLFAAGAVSVASLAFACGGGKLAGGPADGGGSGDGGTSGSSSSSSSSGGSPGADASARPPSAPATKLDVLFMIENASSMASVTFGNDFLTASIPPFFHRLLNPNCVDATGNVLGESQGGQCASGQPEFQPVRDIHVGVVTSSLGGFGGDQCPDNATNPANPNLSAHTDDHGELISRSGVQGNPTVENPAAPIVTFQSESQLVSDVQGLVLGADVHGCASALRSRRSTDSSSSPTRTRPSTRLPTARARWMESTRRSSSSATISCGPTRRSPSSWW